MPSGPSRLPPAVVLGSDRLTKARLTVLAALVAIAVLAIVVGDPLAHPQAGAGEDGARSLEGVPRLAELVALVIAFILALPPSDASE